MKYVITGVLLAAALQGCMMVGPGRAMHDHMMGQSGHGEEHAEKADSKSTPEREHQH